MHVLLIGSGGREHALAWKISKSALLTKLYVLPGNPATNEFAENINLDINNFNEVSKFCKDKNIDLVMIGPEVPLVAGIVDYLEDHNIKCCGPSKYAAQLEGSKAFTHDICKEYNIPAADYEVFTNVNNALEYLKIQKFPIVIKADGIAAGKGVIIAQNLAEANMAVNEIFSGKFGESGDKIVIEEFLSGEEISFFALCDGKNAIYMGSAQDHKAVGEGDTGPNTGGMGTYSPTPLMDKKLEQQIMNQMIYPTLKAMKEKGHPFKGILFAGLMMTKDGPKLLEFNTRFGDPETQVLMMRLQSDLLPLLMSAASGNLDQNTKSEWYNQSAICVVMAAKGYPDIYKKGTEIKNLDKINYTDNLQIFHAGTKMLDNKIVANGGRVLGITAMDNNLKDAAKKAYNIVDIIDWEDGFCRRDIGWRAMK